MGRSGDGIFRDSQARRKEPQLIIRIFAANLRHTRPGLQRLHQHQAPAQGGLQSVGQAGHRSQRGCRRQQNHPVAELRAPAGFREAAKPLL